MDYKYRPSLSPVGESLLIVGTALFTYVAKGIGRMISDLGIRDRDLGLDDLISRDYVEDRSQESEFER